MRYKLFVLIFLANVCYSQEPELKLYRDSASPNLYRLMLFNNCLKPIAIKCSMSFLKYSEKDTLKLGIGEWYNSDGKNYYYGIDRSLYDAHSSEPNPYQLIIINPQTYLITHVELTDFEGYKTKSLGFSVLYSTDITDEEYTTFTKKDTIQLTRVSKRFSTVEVNLE